MHYKIVPLMPARETAITGGGSSIVYYERWIESHEPGTLRDIEDYNRDDCAEDDDSRSRSGTGGIHPAL